MTKHWNVSAEECLGCRYLKAYGLPDEFIRDDHRVEVEAEEFLRTHPVRSPSGCSCGAIGPDGRFETGNGRSEHSNWCDVWKDPDQGIDRQETCSNCGHPVSMHNTSPDDVQCTQVIDYDFKRGVEIRCQCDAQSAGGPARPKPMSAIPSREGWTQRTGVEKTKVRMHCNECGRNFTKAIGPRTYEAKCPKCGGYDTEVV